MSFYEQEGNSSPSKRCDCSCHGAPSPQSPVRAAFFLSAQETFASLDAQIHTVQHALSALQTRRNALLPASRLPLELLLAIFALCVPAASLMADRPRDPPRWHLFSHVCVRWRAAALACPALWTAPCFGRPKLARVMMQRTGSLPLHVRGKLSQWDRGQARARAPESDDIVLEVIGMSERLQTLELNMDVASFNDAVVAGAELARPAPLLESLSLETGDYWDTDWSDEDAEAPFAPALFVDCAPRLRFVRLAGTAIAWRAPILLGEHLRTLFLRHCRNRRAGTWADFEDALRGMTRLETLSIEEALPDADPTGNGRPGSPIELPHLRHLHARDRQRSVSTLVQTIFLPHILCLSIGFRDDSLTVQTLAVLCPTLDSFLRAADSASPLRSMHIDASAHAATLTISVWSDTRTAPALTFVCPTPMTRLSRLFCAQTDAQGLAVPHWTAHLETISVNGDSTLVAASAWGPLFPALGNVRYLKVRGSVAEAFAHALAVDVANANSANGAANLALPALRTLVFWAPPSVPGTAQPWEINLPCAFQKRGAMGMPLHELHATQTELACFGPAMPGVMRLMQDDDAASPTDLASDDEWE